MADSEETPKPRPAGLPNWAIFLMVFIGLAIVAGAAFYMYKRRSAAGSNSINIPAAPKGPNAGAMPGPTNAGLNSGAVAPAAPRLNTNRV